MATSTITGTSTTAGIKTGNGQMIIVATNEQITGSNIGGAVTMAGGNACTVNFDTTSHPWTVVPGCTLTGTRNYNLWITNAATSSFTINGSTTWTASDTVNYVCL